MQEIKFLESQKKEYSRQMKQSQKKVYKQNERINQSEKSILEYKSKIEKTQEKISQENKKLRKFHLIAEPGIEEGTPLKILLVRQSIPQKVELRAEYWMNF